MTEDESLQRAIHEQVSIVAYDPAWPALFAAECTRLLAKFPSQFIDIQHFGSSAIAGMPAKPIIDILAGVESMPIAVSLGEPLCRWDTQRRLSSMRHCPTASGSCVGLKGDERSTCT